MRFYEEHNGHLLWEGFGDFQPTHVHKQVAISFRTPRYRSLEVERPVKAQIQLRRPSDGATSEPLPFEFIPLESGRPTFWSLRRALHKKGDYSVFSGILAANTALLTVGASGTEEAPKILSSMVPALQEDGSLSKLPALRIVTKEKIISEELSTTQTEGYTDTASGKGDNLVTGDKPAVIDYSELNQWKADLEQNDGEDIKMLPAPEETSGDTTRSLNELLSQVAELDEIYSDTRARLLGTSTAQVEEMVEMSPKPMETEDMFDDSQMYSSLQMAMKNPVVDLLDVASDRYEDVVVPLSVVPDSTEPPLLPPHATKRESVPTSFSDSTKLPPLPPKRLKKSPPTPPVKPDHLLAPPEQPLPSVPSTSTTTEATSPSKQTKHSLFQKLFSKKKTRKDSLSGRSRESSVVSSSLTTAPTEEAIFIPLTGPNDLTEAEHYALYTDVAPHATASEFDEMSFYYSPVEGGKIMSRAETARPREMYT